MTVTHNLAARKKLEFSTINGFQKSVQPLQIIVKTVAGFWPFDLLTGWLNVQKRRIIISINSYE